MRRSAKILTGLTVVVATATGAFAVLIWRGFSARDQSLPIEAFLATKEFLDFLFLLHLVPTLRVQPC